MFNFMKDFENYGVVNLTNKEINRIEGGSIGTGTGSLFRSSLYLTASLVHATADFIEGAYDSFNMFKKK